MAAHLTDVTNASRTMLMDLTTLDWDDELLGLLDIPRSLLPQIVPSAHAEHYGTTRADGPFGGEVTIGGALGDQHAAMVGQVCLAAGEAKNTYGTGNFLLLNTGQRDLPVQQRPADHDLLPAGRRAGDVRTGGIDRGHRVGRAVAPRPAEDHLQRRRGRGSGRVGRRCGRGVLRAGVLRAVRTVLAADARGAIVGLSRFHTNAHLARAALDAICFQSRDVMEAMVADAGVDLDVLKVDGGVTANDLCMQIQADVCGVEVSRPVVAETTALGAAYAAGLATGFWASAEELRANWQEDKRWTPRTSDEQRAEGYAGWRKAVQRTLDWVEV